MDSLTRGSFEAFTAFHFLRPEVFWLFLPVVIVLMALWRQGSVEVRWRGVIAPHLLKHLMVRPEGKMRVRPLHLLAAAMLIGVVAAAGPSWRKEAPPLTEDTAPLIIVLDLSENMLVQDVQPSRLERAQQKIRDILDGRKGARTALVAFAGSAHLVLPLTDDPGIIVAFVEDLSPSVMPVPGSDPAKALGLAERMLDNEIPPGTILFLTSGIGGDAVPAFAAHGSSSRDQVLVLAIGTTAGGPIPGSRAFSTLDRKGLELLASETPARVIGVTPDDEDVEELARRMDAHLTAVQRENEEGRWRDEGWWLVWPLAVIVLLWFRRGWLVQWEG